MAIVRRRNLTAFAAAALLAAVLVAMTASRASAAFPGGNGVIAFGRLPSLDSSTYDVLTVPPTGGQPKLLVYGADVDPAPRYSADGRNLVVTGTGKNGVPELFLVSSDGSRAKQITHDGEKTGKGGAADGSLSPTGKRLVYQDQGNERLYVINVNGTHKRKLTSEKGEHPVWSPNGKEIAFNTRSGHSAETLHEEIRVINAKGTHERSVTHGKVHEHPDWSPNGKNLVYASGNFYAPKSTDGLWVVRADGTHNHRILKSHISSEPAFAPNGHSIVFRSSAALNSGGGVEAPAGIFTIKLDGTQKHRLTSGEDNSPGWQPLPK